MDYQSKTSHRRHLSDGTPGSIWSAAGIQHKAQLLSSAYDDTYETVSWSVIVSQAGSQLIGQFVVVKI